MSDTERSQSRASSEPEKRSSEKASAPSKVVPPKEVLAVDDEDDSKYPPMAKAIPVLASSILAMFMVALDRMILATATPAITNEFDSIGDIGWYTSAYLITQAALQLSYGKIYNFTSPKWTYLTCMFIFELGSLICAVSPNSTALIIGRAIAGAGGAGILSGTVMMIVYVLPLRKRPIFQGCMGAVFMISSIAGPLLGGAFTDNVSWRWCFYINLPIGGVAMLLVLIFMNIEYDEQLQVGRRLPLKDKILSLDLLGTALFLPSMVCLILALQWGGTTYAWSNARIIVLLLVFALTFIGWVAVQIWKGENAMVPPRVMSQRSVAAANFFAFCTNGASAIVTIYLATWFQAIQGVSATESGIRMLPSILGSLVASFASGMVTKVTGYYNICLYIGTILGSVGTGLMTTFSPSSSSGQWIGYQVPYGLGVSFGQMQAGMAAQMMLPKKDVSVGVATKFLCQSLGSAIFASVGQNLLSNKLVSGLAGDTSLDAQQIVNTGATDLRNVVSADELPHVLQVYNGAIMSTFQVAVALMAISIIGTATAEWRNINVDKKKKDEEAAKAELATAKETAADETTTADDADVVEPQDEKKTATEEVKADSIAV